MAERIINMEHKKAIELLEETRTRMHRFIAKKRLSVYRCRGTGNSNPLKTL